MLLIAFSNLFNNLYQYNIEIEFFQDLFFFFSAYILNNTSLHKAILQNIFPSLTAGKLF